MRNECNEVVLVSACRTGIAKYGGSLKDIKPIELMKTTAVEAIKRAGITPDMIDEHVLGMAVPHGQGSSPPRICAMQIGMREDSGASTTNQNCASSMRALDVAAMKLAMGQTQIALVSGTECQSSAPYILPAMRFGARLGDTKCQDALQIDGMFDTIAQMPMGSTAENIAEMYGITREECDTMALVSHRRCERATDEGRFKSQIVPVEIKTRKGIQIYDQDENFMRSTDMEKLGKLPPVFKKGGVVTAGNASSLNDASASVVMMTLKKAKELGVKPLIKLVSMQTGGVRPEVMGLGPAVAIPKALKEAGMTFSDIDYWELNEAFAAQLIGCFRKTKEEQGYDFNFGTVEKDGNINNNGSGIGLGHPVGQTGLRLVTVLYYEMERLGATTGVASLCVGGGAAMASVWTRDI